MLITRCMRVSFLLSYEVLFALEVVIYCLIGELFAFCCPIVFSLFSVTGTGLLPS